MVTFQWLQSLGAGCWWPSLSEASVIELGSSYSVLAAPEPSVKPLTLAQEDSLAEYASEGPPALDGLEFHVLSSCLYVSSWAEDAESLSTREMHMGTSLRCRRAGSNDPGEGEPSAAR